MIPPAVAPVDVPPAVLIPVLQIPFGFWAAKTGCPAVALSKEEAEPLCPPINYLINKYLPSVGPYAVELSLAGAILTLVYQKSQALDDWKKAKVTIVPEASVQ